MEPLKAIKVYTATFESFLRILKKNVSNAPIDLEKCVFRRVFGAPHFPIAGGAFSVVTFVSFKVLTLYENAR